MTDEALPAARWRPDVCWCLRCGCWY